MSRFCPKNGGDPKLVALVDQDHEVMAEHLAQRFVLHGRVRLGAHGIAKLPLDHAERRLDVGTLVVVRRRCFFAAP